MTMTHHPAPAPRSATTRTTMPIRWTAVQKGLWVGKTDGEFAGMIERRDGEGYVATTRLAQDLGVFATVAEAKASFAS